MSVTTLEITGLVVPVPEAAAFAAHPHITLLAPFRPRRLLDAKLQHELAALFAPVAAFDFRLVDIRVFPDGHVYLAPEPAEPFRELTNVLAVRYPDTPPYEGLFDDVIPHCTIDTERVPRAIADSGARARGPPGSLVLRRVGCRRPLSLRGRVSATTLHGRRLVVAFTALLFVNTMSGVDSTIVATAAPTITADLGRLALLPWLSSAYLLAQIGTIPLYGALGDRFGRKRVLLGAAVLFLLASMLCGLAQSMPQLVAAARSKARAPAGWPGSRWPSSPTSHHRRSSAAISVTPDSSTH